MFVDFHTHLDWYTDQEELFSQLKRFSGIIVSASEDVSSYTKNLEIADKANALGFNQNLTIIPTFGVHPKNAVSVPSKSLSFSTDSLFNKLCSSSPIIGEIGMDFCWYKEAGESKQEEVFRYFLQHCHEKQKYCVIHTKDAENQICKILEEFPAAKPVIHWYDGPEDVYQEFIKRGYFQTFGCETARSKHIQKLLQQTPLNLILTETDNPTAEPWLGGTDDSIFLIKQVYKDIAECLCCSEEKIEKIIFENAEKILRFFKKSIEKNS